MPSITKVWLFHVRGCRRSFEASTISLATAVSIVRSPHTYATMQSLDTASGSNSRAVPLRFCPNSNDLLYPREDRTNKRLMYFCRNCDYSVAAFDNCVHRRNIYHSAAEVTTILHDVRTDPTLPRSKDVQCTMCDGREAVFFSQTTTEGMSLFFQCITCGNKWKDTGV